MVEFAMLKMNLLRSRITGSTLQAARRSWCIAVTMANKATQNGHDCEMQDKKRFSAALCVAIFHTHTHTHTHKLCLFHLSSYLSFFLLPFLLLFFPTSFSLFLPPSFHSVLSGILRLYLSSLHHYIFLPFLFSFPFSFILLHLF